MAALAIGSQTVGSVLRPAAYCGIVGLKPSHGWTSLEGVQALAPSLDHAGLFTRSVGDAAIAYEPLSGEAPSPDNGDGKAPSFGLLRAYGAAAATPENAAHLDAIATRAGEAGGWVEQVSLPLGPQEVHDITNRVLAYEAGRVHATLFAANEAEYPPHLADLVRRGLAMPDSDYKDAENRRGGLKRALAPLLGTFDALLLPVAPGTAPRSLASTGSSIFCSLASLCGCPSISIPTGVSEEGLPTAVQLVGLETGPLLRAARWLESVVAFSASPSLLSPA
jgi:amidase